MIDPALLTRLREADPETHDRYVNLMRDIDPLCECDIPVCENAILQAVLQDAIRAKGWQGIVLFDEDGSRSVIDGPNRGFGQRDKLSEQTANSPAEALLRAYLAAIEAQP